MAGNIINTGLNLMNTAYNGAGGIVISGDAVKGGYFVTDAIDNIPSWSSVAGTLCYCTGDSKFYQYDGSSWKEKELGANTWRKVQLDGTDKLGTGINTNPLNIKAGSNMTITESNGTFTFAATDTNTDTKVTAVGNHYTPANGTNLTVSSSGTASRGSTKVLTNVAIDAAGHITGGTWYTLPGSDNTDTHYTNYLQINGNGTAAVKFEQNENKTLNLKPGTNVSISAASGEITISATDTTYNAATQSAAGLMSKDDKKKLDGIATEATKVTSDTISGWGYTKNTGTVTSIATSGKGISGGTITSTGTIKLNSSSAGNRGANKVVLAKADGQIDSDKFAVTSAGTKKSTIQYNSTEDCIEFIFA